MEAVPRLPMISFALKESPEAASFGPKLKQYIRDFYNEDPESYNTEIQQIENLRAAAVRPPVNVNGCSILKRYYCQLHFLQSRFPMGKDAPASVNFVWKDLFSKNVLEVANVRYEIIAILYNIGAMHTQLGAHAERTSVDGMKMACTHFQCAAWAFDAVKNSCAPPKAADLTPQLMNFKFELCLAQAQECILEKSMLDNRKPTIVAKVAKQIVDYYGLALMKLDQAIENFVDEPNTSTNKLYKGWRRYIKFKQNYHLAVTQLYQGLAAEEQQKMGERVAFYNASLTCLQEARSIYGNGKVTFTGLPGENKAIEEALTFTNDVIEGKRKAAKNENEYIYHEEVPDKDSLATVKGASLVKGISFSVEDIEVSGPDIFARLVPMKVHEASSLYSEEKAKILRSVGAKIEERDQQLNLYLSSLKLEHLSLWDLNPAVHEQAEMKLPDELVERCAAINARPNAIQSLVDAMKKLSDTYQDVEAMLKDINVLLAEEQIKESKYQEIVGKRPPSIVATDFAREAKKYEEAHAKASESNQALHQAMVLQIKFLKILAQPLASLAAQIPSVRSSISDIDSAKRSELELEKQHTKELKRILSKVDEMRNQRIDLHSKLRDSIAQDDVTRLLVTATAASENLDKIFSKQLSKHQGLVNLIDQNLAAQDNILSALTDAYAQTANVRKIIGDTVKRREQMIASLIASYDTYEELLAKSAKGFEFYRKLEINVAKLLQRVKSACKVQEEERVQILAQNRKPSVSDVQQTYQLEPPKPTTGGSLKLKDFLHNRTSSRAMTETKIDKPPVDPMNYRYQPENVVPYNLDNRLGGYVAPYQYQTETKTDTNGATGGYPEIAKNAQFGGQHVVPSGYPPYGVQEPAYQAQPYIPPSQQSPYVAYGQTPEMMSYNPPAVLPPTQPQPNLPYPSQSPRPLTPQQQLPAQPSSYPEMTQGIKEPPTNQSEYPNQYARMSVATMDNPPSVLSATVQWQQTTEPPQQAGTTRITVSQEQYPQQYPDWQAQQANTYLPYQNTTPQQYAAYDTEMIQSHTKASSQVLVNNYIGGAGYQYPGYQEQRSDSYKGHPGFSFDATAGSYQYSSGYQDSGAMHQSNQDLAAQNSHSRYTNAGSDVSAVTSQTLSTEYAAQNYATGLNEQAYYTMQYGLQQTNGVPVVSNNTGAPLNQTYMQATNNSTNTTSSSETPNQQQVSSQEEPTRTKSNVDLLSDLNITIDQAPLLPEPSAVVKPEQKEEVVNGSTKEETEHREVQQEQVAKAEESICKLEDNLQIVWDTWYTEVQPKKDPLGDPQILQKFILDIEKYEKFVDSLSVKTLSGATNLEIKWKEILDHEERENVKQTTKFASMNLTENRNGNCVPWDSGRVELSLAEGPVYINASFVRDITQWTPVSFIVTQMPMVETCYKFWAMLWYRETEVIACLLSDSQLGGTIYWPTSPETELKVGDFRIKLKNQTSNSVYIRRTLIISSENHKKDREIVHMQFLKWPASGFPNTPGPMLSFAMDVMSEQALRHCTSKPIIVHCLDGGHISSLFLLATAAICHVRVGHGIVEVPIVFSSLFKYRKVPVDKETVYFGYKMVLYHAQDTLMKRGILSSTKSSFDCFEEMKKNKDRSARIMHPSEDFLHNFRGSALKSHNDKMSSSASSASASTCQTSQNSFQSVPDRTKTDPLSELDPLWTIRR